MCLLYVHNRIPVYHAIKTCYEYLHMCAKIFVLWVCQNTFCTCENTRVMCVLKSLLYVLKYSCHACAEIFFCTCENTRVMRVLKYFLIRAKIFFVIPMLKYFLKYMFGWNNRVTEQLLSSWHYFLTFKNFFRFGSEKSRFSDVLISCPKAAIACDAGKHRILKGFL